jgi:hypothetical protein
LTTLTSPNGWSSLTSMKDGLEASVMFGDEAYICLGVHGQIWVQRPQDTVMDKISGFELYLFM